MSIYIVQIIIVIITLSVGIFLLKIADTQKKVRRISRFSLDIPKENTSLLTRIEDGFFKIIHNLSNGLSRYKFVNKISLKYDKYILEINRDKVTPTDYFTIKLVIVITSLSFSLIGVVLNLLPTSPFIFIIAFLASYFLPDLFWKYLYIKRTNRILKDVFKSTKYIYYGLNQKKTIDEAIRYAISNLDGDITDELNKILKDLKHNISLENAYLKFYNRSKIKEVLAIYQNLKIASLLNISYLNAYKYIINENIKTYEEKENTFKIIDIYNYLFLIVLMIPLLVFIFGLFINLDYFAKLMSGKGLYLVVGVIIIYSIYIYIIKNILEVQSE